MAGKRIRVARGRQTGYVDESKLEAAIAEGFSPVTEEKAEELTARRKASTIGQQILGTFEGVARGATAFAYDPIAEALGADMKGVKARKETNPYVTGAAEFAGAIVPGVLSGGTGAAAGVARWTPAGMAARAGGAVARGGGLVRGAAGAAIEAGIEGAGMEASAATLEGREITAERLMSGFGTGAGIGAALGFGFGAAARGLSSASQGVRGLARPTADILPSGRVLSGSARRKAAKGLSALSAVDEDAMYEGLGMLGDSEGRRLLRQGKYALDDQRSKLANQYKDAIDGGNNAWENVRVATGGDSRIANFERHMEPRFRVNATEDARKFVRKQQQQLERILEREQEHLPDFAKRDLSEAIRVHKKARDKLEKTGVDGVHAQRVVDEVRQELHDITNTRFKEFETSKKREVGLSARRMADFRNAAKVHVTDPLVYGKAGKLHAEDISVWSEAMDAERILAKKSPSLAKLLSKDVLGADLQPLVTLAAQRSGHKVRSDALDLLFEKRMKAIDTLERNHDLSPEVKSSIKEFKKLHKQMQDTFEKTADTARKVDVLTKIRQTGETNFSPSSLGSGVLASGLGYGVGGPIGAAVGGALSLASRPAQMLRTGATVLDMINGVKLGESGVLAGISRMIDGTTKAVKKTPVRRSLIYGAVKASRNDNRKEKLLQTRNQVLEYAKDPALLAENLSGDGIHDVDPDLANMRAFVAAKAVAFLHSVAPMTYKPPFQGGAELVDPVQLDQYERYLEAVVDPINTMGRISEGTFTLEHAKALKAVYPSLYQYMQHEALDEVGRREQMGRPMTFKSRMMLGLFLELPLDPSMRPGWSVTAPEPSPTERMMAQNTPKKQSAKLSSDSSTMTSTERIERGGERK